MRRWGVWICGGGVEGRVGGRSRERGLTTLARVLDGAERWTLALMRREHWSTRYALHGTEDGVLRPNGRVGNLCPMIP